MVDGLWQRLNGDQRSMVASPPPVVMQLSLPRSRPVADETSRSGRQVTSEDRQILEVESRLCLAVSSMEMGAPSMVGLVVVHPDRDPIEAAYLRHLEIVRLTLSQNKTLA
jgi:hypothetical protein